MTGHGRAWFRLFTAASLGVAWPAPALAQDSRGGLDLSPYELTPVYENRFDKPQRIAREEDLIAALAGGGFSRERRPPEDAEWIAEGSGGCEVRGGRLWVAPSAFDADGQLRPVAAERRSHMVVWNRNVFPADFLLELGMSPCGSTGGLALVLFCATGKDGEDIFDLALPPRRADYAAYHSGAIANYTDAYWSRNNEAEAASNRLRKNPGFRQVAEGASLTTGPEDATHGLRILKVGGHVEVEVNGQVVLRWDDTERPHGAGRIGLRTMAGVTRVAYDDFRVWRIARRPTR